MWLALRPRIGPRTCRSYGIRLMTSVCRGSEIALRWVTERRSRQGWGWYRLWVASAITSTLQLVGALDTTVSNMTLPRAQTDFGIADADRQWVVRANSLAFGTGLLLGGRLAAAFAPVAMVHRRSAGLTSVMAVATNAVPLPLTGSTGYADTGRPQAARWRREPARDRFRRPYFCDGATNNEVPMSESRATPSGYVYSPNRLNIRCGYVGISSSASLSSWFTKRRSIGASMLASSSTSI